MQSDFQEAQKCLEDSLTKANNKRALRFYSIVVRQSDTNKTLENFKRSIEIGKKAVAMDMKDGYSWCSLNRCFRECLPDVIF